MSPADLSSESLPVMQGADFLLVFFCPAFEVIDLHRMLDFCESLLCLRSCSSRSFSQSRYDFLRVSLVVCSLLSDRSQEIVEDSEEELLDLDIAEAASLIMCLEFVEILVLWKVFLERIS